MARRLLILNGLAILGVVLNHSASRGFIAMFWWTDRYLPVTVPNFDQTGSLSYYALRLIEQLVAFSVPSFLLVSGFFIAFVAGETVTDTWKVARSRIWVLIPPYLIWSVVTVVSRVLQGEDFTLLQVINVFLFGKADEHFYFIPLLIQLYLLSPLLIAAARYNWRLLLLTAALIQLVTQVVRYPDILGSSDPLVITLVSLSPGWLFTTKVFWFCLGIVACQHLEPMMNWLHKSRWYLLFSWAALLVLGLVSWEMLLSLSGRDWIPYYDTFLDSFYACAFILMFMGFDGITIPFSKRLGSLGTKSYGIYLIHGLALTFAAKAVYHLAPRVLAYQIIYQPILILFGLGLPLALMYLVEKSPAKRYSRILFG